MTGAGMMDCKAALGETDGDMEAAVDWLRKKGLSKAAKKAGRVAAEGLIGIVVKGTEGRRGRGQFRDRLRRAQRPVPGPGEDDRRRRARRRRRRREDQGRQGRLADDRGMRLSETIAKIGENMTLRRAAELSVGKGAIGSYVHNSVSDGLGKIGVLVALEVDRQGRRACRARPAGRDAYRRRQSAGGRCRRRRSGGGAAREGRAGRQVQAAGQARER